MEIYIPKNMENIEIISQLKKMIQGYSDYYEKPSTSFDNYYYYLKHDSVYKFISLCINEEDITDSNELDEVIIYLSRLFYSVKGTPKVFDFMTKYLGIEFLEEPIYTVDKIILNIKEINTSDFENYCQSLKNFLSTLLYFGDLKMTFELLNLYLSSVLTSNTYYYIKRYKKFVVQDD